MLAKILYVVIIVLLLSYGFYFLYMSGQDLFQKDQHDFDVKSAAWNNTYLKEFEDWKISLKNEMSTSLNLDKDYSKMHQYEDSDALYYSPFQFGSNNMANLIHNIKLNKKKSDSSNYSYNLTANIYLELDDTFKTKNITLEDVDLFIRAPVVKMKHNECVKNKGLWNYEDQTCYKYFVFNR